jgi:hypothetical protein
LQVFATAKAINSLSNKGVALFLRGRPLLVNGRIGLALKLGVFNREMNLSHTHMSGKIRQLAQIEFGPGLHCVDIETVDIESLLPKQSGISEINFQAMYDSRDTSAVSRMAEEHSFSEVVNAAVGQIGYFKSQFLLETAMEDAALAGEGSQAKLRIAVNYLINQVVSLFEIQDFDITIDIPEYSRMIGLKPLSAGHEGISASLHTTKILLLLSNIKNWAAGEREFVASELKGKKGAAFANKHHYQRTNELLGYLDEFPLSEHLDLVPSEKQLELVREVIALQPEPALLNKY